MYFLCLSVVVIVVGNIMVVFEGMVSVVVLVLVGVAVVLVTVGATVEV